MAILEQPTIMIYDKDGQIRDWLRAPESVRVTARWNEVGTADIDVQQNDPRVQFLKEPGARVQISLRGEHLIGGPVTAWSMSGPDKAGWSFTITDDLAILDRLLILPNPALPLNQQPSTAMTYRGHVETCLLQMVKDAAAVLDVDIAIPADQGRGDIVTIQPRWQTVNEVIGPLLRKEGLGVSMEWQPGTNSLQMTVKSQKNYPFTLSPASRTVTSWDVSWSAPTATRVYIEPGSSTQTQMAQNPIESQVGKFLRGATFRQADNADEVSAVASDALNDTSVKTGMSISLAESETIRYGGPTGLHVGDRAKIIIGRVEIEDVVREVVVEWSPGQALTVRPGVGAWDNSPVFALADAVRRIASTVKRAAFR